MPHGLPSAIPLTRSEWALDFHTSEPVQLTAGTVVLPQYPLADQDGWNGEWLCLMPDGKELAIPGMTLTFHAPS